MKKILVVNAILILSLTTSCQSDWPSKTWANAINLSSSLPSDATEISGLYWNQNTSRLYCVGDGGSFYLLQLNKATNSFTLVTSATNIGAPEGITQVDNASNEFYTIDENSYEIRKHTYDTNFANITKVKSWNLLHSPSPMVDTGNTGPEGICFVPDSYLQKIGFISSATGDVYTSKKGMGGLLFLAHQNGGYVWAFDVNPIENNDFLFVGKYKTNRSESCDLAFDNSTGLMYILHNLDDNYLEVTDLKTSVSGNVYTLTKQKEYNIPNPTSGSINIEGFAISPKYPESESLGVWLCRDVTSSTEKADALRWFNPYTADGSNIQTAILNSKADSNSKIFVRTTHNTLRIMEQQPSSQQYSIEIASLDGKIQYRNAKTILPLKLMLNKYQQGISLIRICDNSKQVYTFKFVI